MRKIYGVSIGFLGGRPRVIKMGSTSKISGQASASSYTVDDSWEKEMFDVSNKWKTEAHSAKGPFLAAHPVEFQADTPSGNTKYFAHLHSLSTCNFSKAF